MDLCWIHNRQQAQMYKDFLNEITHQNKSKTIELLIFYNLNPNLTTNPEIWSQEIDKIKLIIQENIYNANPAEELSLCIIYNVLWTIIPAIILFFGTIGNVMSFIVLCNFTGKTVSTFIYLSLLAIVDEFVLIFGLLKRWTDYLLKEKIENRNKIFCVLSQFFGTTASVFSVWLIVAVTLERAIVISFPFKAHNLIQKSRAILISIIMGVVIVFLNSHFIFTVDLLNSTQLPDNPTNQQICGFSSKFVYMKTIWLLVDGVIYSFLPFIFIFVLNIVILVKVCQARKTRQSMITLNRGQKNVYRSESTRQLTIMLLMISGTFLITTTPIFIVKMVVVAPKAFVKQIPNPISRIKEGVVSQFADSVAEILMHLNHAMNFYLYCASGNKFRACLKALFRKCQLIRCFQNSSTSFTVGQNSLFVNSMKMARNHNDSKSINEDNTLQIV